MKRRKVLSLLLAAVMLTGSIAGCGSNGGTNAETNQGGSAAGTESADTGNTGDKSYTMFIRSQYHDWIEELNWYDVAKENTGITVEYVDGPEETSDTYTEVDQRIASGTLPEATMCKLSQAKV